MLEGPHSVRRTRSSNRGSRNRWQDRLCEETGQSIVIIVLAMGLILALSAYAIDVSDWDAKRHQAQVSADAAALAAANCLATNATAACSNSSATAKANAYANANGVPASNVTIGSTAVTVTTQTPAPQVFSGMFGVHTTVHARAVASYTAGISQPMSIYGADCTNPTNPPTTGCTVDCNTPGVTINAAGQTNVSGSIVTNGSVSVSLAGGGSLGPVEYGQGCPGSDNSVSLKGGATIADGPAAATAFAGFPATYSGVWTSATSNECTASSVYTASGYPGSGFITATGGTSTIPSTVTIDGNNINVGSSASPVVICASTSISIPNNQATLTDVTLVAPSITISKNGLTITPDPNATPDGGGSPAVALYETGTATLVLQKNNINVTGAVYTPLAETDVQGNNGGSAVFEGNTVEIDGNNGADGPSTPLTAFDGGDSLSQ